MPTKRICTIAGCDKPVLARGWCGKHYQRWTNNGDPEKVIGTPPGTVQQYFRKLLTMNTEECLIWPFSRDNGGYGEIGYGDGKIDVHQLVCLTLYGPRPSKDHEACHSCGRGLQGCVNPKHLRWDTRQANNDEMLQHGTRLRGGAKPRANFTDDQVRHIRVRLATGETPTALAREFGADPRRVSEIKHGRSYIYVV